MKKPSLIFLGTPEFAIPSLQKLIDEGFEIKLVVTQPDRPSGRGKKITPPPVKELALLNDIEVFQPESLRKNKEEREKILEIECDFLIVVAFGQILPVEILEHAKIAPLNVHSSLLPAYRGAAPIARAITEGEEKTGVTIQWMVEALDMGDILYQIPSSISESDTAETLHDRLKDVGAQALTSCLHQFENNQIVRTPQDARIGSYASKLEKAESKIDFKDTAFNVHRKIMGLNPWPVAECQLMGERLRVFESRFVPRPAEGEPGTVVDITNDEIIVACGEACVGFTLVQQENKKRMPVSEFLKGRPLPTGLIFGGLS